VQWLRAQPDQQSLVRDCYYDDPLVEAAERFYRSAEWDGTRALLVEHLPGDVLDLGAGRGIASWAFARDGCRITALEPDPSAVVGRGAIEQLSQQTGVKIRVVAGYGEDLPFADDTFDVVYGRAVLHHARDLGRVCREIARVLRPRGCFLAVREHVASNAVELDRFLQSHPLHALYGGEHAYTCREYRRAIRAAGLQLQRVLGHYDSVVNYWPRTEQELRAEMKTRLGRWVGTTTAAGLLASPPIRRLALRGLSRFSRAPGRHFAFLGTKE
jgi:SAM-dependent methyltransferase